MSVSWTETAIDQLVAIRNSVSRTSPGYAQVLVGRIVRRTELLATQPLMGPEVPEYGDPNIRELFEHPYRILYRVAATEIQIVAVIHSARRLPTHPPS